MIDKPAGPPGVRFVYSDINFILMGEIVRRLSGKMLTEFARENIFEPLGMHDTMFLPPASLRPRIAPTELDPATGQPLRGVVHDDTSRYMGGVAGHAGLFTTADDLAKFAQMMLDRGEGEWQCRLFSAATIEKFTSPHRPPISPFCAAWAGISIRRIPAIAASCFPSAPTATPDSRALPSGSIPPAAPT